MLATLALTFGHAVVPPQPLGQDEAIGTVFFVDGSDNSHYVLASYSPEGQPDVGGVAEGFVKRAVADGQTVVVRYDPAQPMTGTVVSQSTPRSRPNGLYGAFVVTTALALGIWGWVGAALP